MSSLLEDTEKHSTQQVENIQQVALEFYEEYLRARQLYRPFPTLGHGLETIREEFDELVIEARKKGINVTNLRGEAIQVGAMVLAFIVDLIDSGKLNKENIINHDIE